MVTLQCRTPKLSIKPNTVLRFRREMCRYYKNFIERHRASFDISSIFSSTTALRSWNVGTSKTQIGFPSICSTGSRAVRSALHPREWKYSFRSVIPKCVAGSHLFKQKHHFLLAFLEKKNIWNSLAVIVTFHCCLYNYFCSQGLSTNLSKHSSHLYKSLYPRLQHFPAWSLQPVQVSLVR